MSCYSGIDYKNRDTGEMKLLNSVLNSVKES